MTKRQIALVCAIAGLTMVEGFLTINAIAEGFYNCNPDPYHSETCLGQVTANFAVLIGPWLVATYLLARGEAIVLFACLLLGWMWGLGLFGAVLLDEAVRPSPQLDEVGAHTFFGSRTGLSEIARDLEWSNGIELDAALALSLPQHPDQHRSEGPVLRSRSGARRKRDSPGSPRTRRSGRLARSREA
jgi:hypothetical protein